MDVSRNPPTVFEHDQFIILFSINAQHISPCQCCNLYLSACTGDLLFIKVRPNEFAFINVCGGYKERLTRAEIQLLANEGSSQLVVSSNHLYFVVRFSQLVD